MVERRCNGNNGFLAGKRLDGFLNLCLGFVVYGAGCLSRIRTGAYRKMARAIAIFAFVPLTAGRPRSPIAV